MAPQLRLSATEQIRVGVSVLPVPLRSGTQAAMEIATIDRIFPGRFVAGIGHGEARPRSDRHPDCCHRPARFLGQEVRPKLS